MADKKTNENAAEAGGGDNPKKPTKKGTIEHTYQKKSQLEHILLRPDTYIGSVERTKENMWIYDNEAEKIIQKSIEFTPGLYKIFDEILVNAADNKQRDPKMDSIRIDIKPDENMVSVWNNGKGIPVVMHKEENMFVPSMIFGHLLTSSNYNDEEEKVTGGRNGYGAKLCNIFSTKFTVETASKDYKKQFKQTWGSNMTKASDPKIKDFSGDDFTKITFWPDLAKFKMDKLDEDIVGLMSRRAFDVAASSRGVKVFLNDKRLPVKNFKDYIDLYIKGKDDEMGNPLKIIHEQPNERWEVAMTLSEGTFQQMSFVNSIATTKGGKHVDYIVDMIVKQVSEIANKKNKGGVKIKAPQIKSHLWIFINCLIVNPTFDSQTKENMTLQTKNFGSKCALSDKFMNLVAKCGIVESVLTWAKVKADNVLAKTSGKKMTRLKGIAKLEDANEAGGRNALKCTLILTEGDSAKSLAVSGLGVIGRDYYGVFPLRGKLLNVREATHKQILENAEINNLIKILGLQYKKKYLREEDMKTLRYGKVMIMTDQDQDGSHIKGLLINFIHHNWPELLRQDFLEEFITPIVKARKRNEELSFYSLPEFEEWKNNTPNSKSYTIKYYKGLGTSSSKEAKEYFSNMTRHRIRFRYEGKTDDDQIMLAFSKKHVDDRKEWLTNFMEEARRRRELGLAERYLYTKDTKVVTFTDFINKELVLFSNADNVRSIPCFVDGLKPGQRKVLFTCIKRNDKREVKVAQLAGSVAEHSAYHHGEVSLCMTIVNLAQNYVGSNNINILEPRGQFGTRLSGGKDSASPRYIFTKMSPLTRMIFHPHDDALLRHEYDDNQKIEPVWYIPIIPMVLVNGADGIGTGWMTKINNYNPRDIVANLRAMMDGDEPKILVPWYKNFKGTIEFCGEGRYSVSGEIAIIGHNKLEITELPVGTWTQNYKENVLEPLVHGTEKVKAVLEDYKEYNTDTTVKFVITVMANKMEELEKAGFHKVFKLQTLLSTSSMCAFDQLGCLKKYDSVMDILTNYYQLRLKLYQDRKNYLEGMLDAEAARLSNQARFIMEKCNRTLVVENKKRKNIVAELIDRKYQPDPVKEWKDKNKVEEGEQAEGEAGGDEEEEDEDGFMVKKKKEIDPEKEFKNSSDVKKFDYLLGMSMWMLTDEKKNDLLKQRDIKVAELETLKRKTSVDLWRQDLDTFMQKLDEVERKELKEEAGIKSELKKPTLAKGRKPKILETLPSPMAERIAPTITDEIKKKVHMAAKSKENRDKKAIKKESISDEDEFDEMVKSKKTLAEKLGTPEEIEKKAKAKLKKPDGWKQTKLAFPKKAQVNGSPKKRGKKKPQDSDEELSSGSDDEFKISSSPPIVARERPGRARKVMKYNLSDDEDEKMDSDDGELRENSAIVERNDGPVKADFSSHSEDEGPPPQPNQSCDDLFESLIRSKSPSPPAKKKPVVMSDTDDEAVVAVVSKTTKKPAKKTNKETQPKKPRAKKKKLDSSDEDRNVGKSKKKRLDSSDEDFSFEAEVKKDGGRVGGEDLEDSDVFPVFKSSRRGRGPPKSYAGFVDSDDSD